MPLSNEPGLARAQASDAPAICVDCTREIPPPRVFRVLRTDRAGRRHVVCQDCADRRHAEVRPTPLQVQRAAPPRAGLGKPLQRQGHGHDHGQGAEQEGQQAPDRA